MKAFGREFSSDESGDGPGVKRRAVEHAEGVAELRAVAGSGGVVQPNARRLQRMVAAWLLRGVVEWWRETALRQVRVREATDALERAAVEFPIETAEQAGVALALLNGRACGWSWAKIASAFQVSASTLRGMAAQKPGAGARVSNRVIESLNSVWQERMLEDQGAASGSESEEAPMEGQLEDGDHP